MDTSITLQQTSKTTTKRVHERSEESVSPQNNKIQCTSSVAEYIKYIVIESKDDAKSMAKLSPFVIEKVMIGTVGVPIPIRKMRSGALLVEAQSISQTNQLMRMSTFFEIPVRVSAHRSLNSCKGVVRSFDLATMDPNEIVAELSSSGVTEARVITQMRNGERKITPVVVLSFLGGSVPQAIRAGYINLKVSPYIPNPMKCIKCHRFGHTERTCSRSELCAKCGQAAHENGSECINIVKCINCQGDHSASSNKCPKYLIEKEICKVKAQKNLPFPEARKLVAANQQQQRSYSAVILESAVAPAPGTKSTKLGRPTQTSITSVSIGTQTSVTHCVCADNYKEKRSKQGACTVGTQTDDASDEDGGSGMEEENCGARTAASGTEAEGEGESSVGWTEVIGKNGGGIGRRDGSRQSPTPKVKIQLEKKGVVDKSPAPSIRTSSLETGGDEATSQPSRGQSLSPSRDGKKPSGKSGKSTKSQIIPIKAPS